MYLEHVLPYFRNGGRIRHISWRENSCIIYERGRVVCQCLQNSGTSFVWITSCDLEGLLKARSITCDSLLFSEGWEFFWDEGDTKQFLNNSKEYTELTVNFKKKSKDLMPISTITFKKGENFRCKIISNENLLFVEKIFVEKFIDAGSGEAKIVISDSRRDINFPYIYTIETFLNKVGINSNDYEIKYWFGRGGLTSF